MPILIDIPKGLEKLAWRYINVRQKELPVFQRLLESAEFEEIRRLSHNLKGTGTSYGFPDITRLGAAIESASKQKDISDLSLQMLALSDYVEAAMQQVPPAA